MMGIMRKMKLVVVLALCLALVLVVLQNTDTVHVSFLWLKVEMPAILLLFLTAAGGFFSGLLVALLMKGSAKPKSQNSSGRG
jgi:uncharacterized integral membrane protein